MGQKISSSSSSRTSEIENKPNENPADSVAIKLLEKNPPSNMNTNSEISLPNVDDVKQLEADYAKAFKNSENELLLLEDRKIPCKNYCNFIINCLRDNPKQIGNCIDSMENYRQCVHDAYMMKINDK